MAPIAHNLAPRIDRLEVRQDTLGDGLAGMKAEVTGLRHDVRSLGDRIDEGFSRMGAQLSVMAQQQADVTQRLVKLETKDQAADKRLSRREKVGVGVFLAACGAFIAKFSAVFGAWF